ncbi:unnamed protein product [Pleuronectes platessa]|uniref:Uncharacterized protein n=1 Tax=Pleuronectes platessa TaxID=8262 RepID=A0A9N7U7A8_PLEPL|nr:unnamed protein product [Pleuronectes platessa]
MPSLSHISTQAARRALTEASMSPDPGQVYAVVAPGAEILRRAPAKTWKSVEAEDISLPEQLLLRRAAAPCDSTQEGASSAWRKLRPHREQLGNLSDNVSPPAHKKTPLLKNSYGRRCVMCGRMCTAAQDKCHVQTRSAAQWRAQRARQHRRCGEVGRTCHLFEPSDGGSGTIPQ